MTRAHVVALLSLCLAATAACQNTEESPSIPPLELTDMAESQSYSAIEEWSSKSSTTHADAVL